MVNRNIQGLPALQPAGANPKDSATVIGLDAAKKAQDKSPEKSKPNQTAKSGNPMNETMKTTTGGAGTTTGKFSQVKGNVSKREVEQNPFKALLDITDLVEMEGQSAIGGPKEIEKEV